MNTTVKRSISGAIFLAVMLGGLLLHEALYVLLFAFMTGAMLYEFYRITLGTVYGRLQYIAIFAGVFLFFMGHAFFFTGGKVWLLGFLAVMLVMAASVFQKDQTSFGKTACLYAGLLYIALPLALSNAVVCKDGEFNGLLMVAFFCIIWASDVGAYVFGMLLGQKIWPAKMCPLISPKKSWAGFVGGWVMALVAAMILKATGLMDFPWVHLLVMASLMHVSGVCGDLFESLWKRSFGVKDSGNLIPGHGGLLDRFDSSLFAIPAAYIYLLLLGLV